MLRIVGNSIRIFSLPPVQDPVLVYKRYAWCHMTLELDGSLFQL